MPGLRSMSVSQKVGFSVIALCAVAVGGLFLFGNHPAVSPEAQQNVVELQQVRDTVTTFGSKLSQVSLLAPETQLRGAMQAQYGGLVSPQLISAWEADPTHAMGRLTSSPWPAGITITSMAKTAPDAYTVSGTVDEVTSAGPAASYPVVLTLTNLNGSWQITEVQQSAPPSKE